MSACSSYSGQLQAERAGVGGWGSALWPQPRGVQGRDWAPCLEGAALFLQLTLLFVTGISHIVFTQGTWALLEVLFIDPESWESRQLLAEPHSVRRACCPGSCLLSHLASPQPGLKCQLMGPSTLGGEWGVSPGGPTTTRSNTTTTTTPNRHRRAPRLQPNGQLWELAGRWVLWGGGVGDRDKPEFQWHMQGRVGGLVQGHTAGVGQGWDSDPALSASRAPL